MDTDRETIIDELHSLLSDKALEARLRALGATDGDKEWLERVYRAVYGRHIERTCGNCLYDAYIMLRVSAKRNIKEMEERIKCRFALKAGAILRIENPDGGRTLVSNANLTDAVARKWLKEHPNTANLFATIPDDFDISDGEATQTPTPVLAPAKTSAKKAAPAKKKKR